MAKVACPALVGNTHLSPLRQARASALLDEIKARGYLELTRSEYRLLREDGFSRKTVDRAINDLASLGLVEIIPRLSRVSVRPVTKNDNEVAE